MRARPNDWQGSGGEPAGPAQGDRGDGVGKRSTSRRPGRHKGLGRIALGGWPVPYHGTRAKVPSSDLNGTPIHPQPWETVRRVALS